MLFGSAMKKRLLKYALVVALPLMLMLPPNAVYADFKGGRDIAMGTVGVVSVTLLATLIWQAVSHDNSATAPKDSTDSAKHTTPEAIPGIHNTTQPADTSTTPSVTPE